MTSPPLLRSGRVAIQRLRPIALLLALSVAACGDRANPTGPGPTRNPPLAPGVLTVLTATLGSAIDSDGYLLAIDSVDHALPSNARTVIPLAAGRHSLTLSGVAGNCGVSAGLPLSITVVAGSAATLQLTVECLDLSNAHGLIAFATNRFTSHDNLQIAVMTQLGTVVRRLTSDTLTNRWPAWSPDGKRIAYSCGDDVCVMNGDGADRTVLTEGTRPAWSPDGKRILFTRWDTAVAQSHVFVMNADGSGVAELSMIEGQGGSWSPDGARIVFGCYAICIIGADGAGLTRVPVPPSASGDWPFDPVWSPDGSQVAYITSAHADDGVLALTSLDGAHVRALTKTGATGVVWPTSPSWSKDGSVIAFEAGPEIVRSIYLMQPDATGPRMVTPRVDSRGPFIRDVTPSIQP